MHGSHALGPRPDRKERKAGTAPHSRQAARLFLRRLQIGLVLADAGLSEIFFLVALAIGDRVGVRMGLRGGLSGPLPILLAIVFPVIVGSLGLYRVSRFRTWRGQAAVGIRAVAWSVGLSVGGLFLFAQEIPWSLRIVLIVYHVMLGLWMVALRPWVWVSVQRALHASYGPPERVLLVGSDPAVLDLARAMTRRRRTQVVGCADPERPPANWPHPFFLSELEEIPDLADDLGAEVVVLARPELPREEVVRVGDRLVMKGIGVRVARNVFNALIDSLPIEQLGGVPLVPAGHTPLSGRGETLKRVFDVTAASIGGLLVLPAILVLALLVRLSSPGPVLYRQIRIGRGGKPFVFYKFRSMRVAPDDPVHEQYVKDLVGNGAAAAIDVNGHKVYKLVDESRITAIGRFLRRTSLDELPQLINVFRGEMSLVGPRPCLPFEWDIYKEWQKRRLEVTPGMTGLWQVTGRSFVTFDDMVLLDLFYIANWSFGMDLKLLLRTIPVMIWGKGGL